MPGFWYLSFSVSCPLTGFMKRMPPIIRPFTFALFIGISMSITAFPVLARIIQERNMTKTPLGTLAIASAANDDVTAWCLLAVVIAISKAGSFASALYSVGLAVVYIAVMFLVVRPFLKRWGRYMPIRRQSIKRLWHLSC